MLNELYDLSLSLERAGITPTDWHPDLKELPKVGKDTLCFKVYIAENGEVADIESIEESTKIEGLRKWQNGSNGYSFPCFNVKPLFKAFVDEVPDAAEKKRFDDWSKELKGSTSEYATLLLDNGLASLEGLWRQSDIKLVSACLGEIPSELKQILGITPIEYSAMSSLIERCCKTSGEKFFEQLKIALKARIVRNPSVCEKYVSFLLHCGTKPPNAQLILELNDGLSAFPLPAANSKTHYWINQRLLANPEGRGDANAAKNKQADAFGFARNDWKDKLPEVKVPNLGLVKLRAMNKESACQTRYRQVDATSYVVGAEVRKRIKGALEWLTDNERNGKTWGSVSSARDDNEILLAYPSEIPRAPIAAVAMFGGASVDSATNSARFVDYAEDVIRNLKGLSRPLKDVEMRVFALRKMDKARTQISCARQYSAQRLADAAQEWQKGCGNLPLIEIKQWGKLKGTKPEWHSLEIPFPLEVVWCLNTPWSKAADDAKKRLKEFSCSEAIGLLLDEGVRLKPLLARALHAAVRNSGNLLIATACAQHVGNVHSVNGKYDKQKLLLPSIFGLLLAKLDLKKEDYMKNAPHLIGRMLSLADQIHDQYCRHVRKGNSPSQLIGNALMATALEEPEKALALYAQRILPYQAWAKTAKGEDEKLARWLLGQLAEVSSEVSKVEIPRRCADADKAQMILGYLAKNES